MHNNNESASNNRASTAAIIVLLFILLLFAPIVLVLIEALCFRTRNFEEILELLGVHGFLGEIYKKTGLLDTIRTIVP